MIRHGGKLLVEGLSYAGEACSAGGIADGLIDVIITVDGIDVIITVDGGGAPMAMMQSS